MPETRHRPVALTVTRSLTGGSGVSAHYHDEHQIVYASTGVLAVATSAGAWIAPATRAVLIPAGTVHEHRAYGQTVLHTVGLPQDALTGAEPVVVAVRPLLRELLITCSARPQDTSPATLRLRAVLTDQLRDSPERPLHVPAPSDPRLVELGALLDRDPADPRSLTGFATTLGSSARTLSRLCREELGMTFPQWRTQLRMYHALRLLAEDQPVTAVAHRCGWATPSSFIEAFRRVMGYTPGRRTRAEF
ncbi:helix-turn-helix transcriptional regulator [Sciscionella marina]|uniref:helix-turn-helix transcriptional regulator n=1 Tax=Sciscionella marina TaxID=508770 RepID=UPI0004783037|nr:helix-turn-helix transcriptional regulator [Sciscionella marina]